MKKTITSAPLALSAVTALIIAFSGCRPKNDKHAEAIINEPQYKYWQRVAIGSIIQEYPTTKESSLNKEFTDIYNRIKQDGLNKPLKKELQDVFYNRSTTFKQFIDSIWNEAKQKTSATDLQTIYASERINNSLHQLNSDNLLSEISASFYSDLSKIRSIKEESWVKRKSICTNYNPANEMLTFKELENEEQFKLDLKKFEDIRSSVYKSWKENIENQVKEQWDRTFYLVYPARGYTYTKEMFMELEGGKRYDEDIKELVDSAISRTGGMPDVEWRKEILFGIILTQHRAKN